MDTKKILRGEPVDGESVNEVKDVPEGFKEWEKKNEERIAEAKKAGTLPRFVRENKEHVEVKGVDIEDKRGDNGNMTEVETNDIIDKVKQLLAPITQRLYVAFEPFSPAIINAIRALKSRKEKNALYESIMNDERAKVHNDYFGVKTIEYPGHQGKRHKTWTGIKETAFALNELGISVAFLPEGTGDRFADSLLKIGDRKYILADFKYCTTKNSNTLAEDLIDGFGQANYIVLNASNMDVGGFKAAIKQVLRKTNNYGNLIIMNKYGKIKELSRKDIKLGRYKIKIKGFL